MTVGDTVSLKSGGPLMTVNSMIGGSECECIWFDDEDHLQKSYFPTNALMKASTPTKKKTRPA